MKEDKRRIKLTIIGVLTLLLTIIGATYAYFAADLGGGTNANINASTGTTDSLTFDAGDPIRIHASLENFAEGMESLKGNTTATATLKANNTTNQATGKYNIFFVIDDNDFVYSSEDGQAELVLKVTDPNGKEVEDITGLKRVEDGFDITTRTGGFLVRADYEIETTSTTEQTWQVEVTLVNLDSDQNINMGKTLNGRFYITTDQISTYEIAKINAIDAETTYESIKAKLNFIPGSSEVDKYYYAIEEDTSSVALLGFSNNILRTSTLAAKELNYIESEEPTHTFDNLKPNTRYKVYSYAKDKQGINSNVYETSITTSEYELPKVTGLTHISELYKITVTATSEAGSNEVSKYYFSKDNGSSWSEPQESPTYVFDNLLDTTTYNIKVKVSDTENKYSTEYYEAIATSTYINPSVTTAASTKTYNSITLTATASKGTNNISKYYFSKDNGATWSEGQASNVYTYAGLSENTTYNIKVKVEDTNGRMSNPYSLDVTTNTYRVPSVSATTTKTSSSITVSATGTAGDGSIAKYMYSKDGGSNWVTNTSTATTNSYTFSGLTRNTEYQIRIKVVDENNRESSVYSVTTKTAMGDFSGYIKTLYTSQGSNGIYYHTSSLANSAGDNSYRYAGANPNNYVCFGSTASICPSDNLYRIIGVFGDQVKLIKNIGLQSNSDFYWNGTDEIQTNIWSKSLLNTKTLNGTYLTELGTTWTNKIVTTTWYVGGVTVANGLRSNAKTAYNYEVGTRRILEGDKYECYLEGGCIVIEDNYKSKIGLMYLNDYYYAATPTYWTYPGFDTTYNNNDYQKSKGNNWIAGLTEWTITRNLHTSASGLAGTIYIVNTGWVNGLNIDTYRFDLKVRPVFFLSSVTNLILGGSGTQSDPFRIEL